MRKFLSNAFSDRSLKEQEHLIAGGIDISIWFNLLTFDIIGELAFGESFGGIRSGRMTMS